MSAALKVNHAAFPRTYSAETRAKVSAAAKVAWAKRKG
jgi:hypothetical protein